MFLSVFIQAEGFAGFLRPLLTYVPEERPSASKMLQHPWLVTPLVVQPDEAGVETAEAGSGQGVAAAGQPARRSKKEHA